MYNVAHLIPPGVSMKIITPLVFVIIGVTSTAGAQAKAPEAITPQQLLELRSFSDLRFAPDGSRVACVVTEPAKGTTRARHVWMLDVKSRSLRQFTNSMKTEESPRWSPDGTRLAFISDREEQRQIYLIPLNGGEAS